MSGRDTSELLFNPINQQLPASENFQDFPCYEL